MVFQNGTRKNLQRSHLIKEINMDENQYWIKFFKIAAIVIVILTSLGSACAIQNNYMIGKAISDGIDPIKAKCAFSASDNLPICALLNK